MNANSMQPRRPFPWKSVLLQGAVVCAIIALAVWFTLSTWNRLRASGIANGFDVFLRPAGMHLNSPFMSQGGDDSYLRVFIVSFVNTLGTSLISIALAFCFGLLLGVGVVARNKIVSVACTVYVEIFRNIPLILQAVFWYTTITMLPGPRQHPFALSDLFYLSNQGVFLAGAEIAPRQEGRFVGLCVFVVILFILAACLAYRRTQAKWRSATCGLLASVIGACLFGIIMGWPLIMTRPVLHGFSFNGGWTIAPEFLALVFSCVVFSSAYIAEIFRGGLQSVPKGLVEAAQSLGLPSYVIFLKIRTPIAFRSMIPAMSNIFLFVVKATAIGAAIGFADLYAVTVVTIAQTGQTIEFLFVMMAAYFVLNYSITQIMGWINRKIAFKGNRS